MKKLGITFIIVLLLSSLIGAFPGAAAGMTVTRVYGDVTTYFHSQDLWDITDCNLTVSFSVEFPRGTGQAQVGITDGATGTVLVTASSVDPTAAIHPVTLTFHSIENLQGNMFGIVDGALPPGYALNGQHFEGDDLSQVRIMASTQSSKAKISNLTVEGCLSVSYVALEVEPDSENCLTASKNGAIPVVIFGTDDFNVEDISAASLNLSGLSVRQSGKKGLKAFATYFDSDKYADLVVQFDTNSGTFAPEEGKAVVLTGMLRDYTPIEGVDVVCLSVG